MIVLYTNHCVRCKILRDKLIAKNIEFTEVDDFEILKSKNFDLMPVLEVEGELLSFGEANRYIEDIK